MKDVSAIDNLLDIIGRHPNAKQTSKYVLI